MSYQVLLDYIAQFESRGDYNIVWGGIATVDKPPKPLVEMTVQQVLDWQDRIDSRYMSEAAGKYQILEDTLRGLYRAAGVPLAALFNETTQDKLGLALLRRRGLDDYLAGRITTEKFALSLAKEWASLPVPYTLQRNGRTIHIGQSYYAGDGLNKAHADLADFLAAIEAVKGRAAPDPKPVGEIMAKSTTQLSALGAIVTLFASLSETVTSAISTVSENFGISPQLTIILIVVCCLLWIMRERWLKALRLGV